MTFHKFQVATYKVRYERTSNLSMVINNTQVKVPRIAGIMCRAALTQDYPPYLQIYFVPPNIKTPQNTVLWEKKRGWMFLPIAEFTNVLDLLRHEKPIYVFLEKEPPHKHYLSTDPEPVGEEEGA